MAKKISRSGKKKKSMYANQPEKKETASLSAGEKEMLARNKRFSMISLILLVVAMVGLLFAPQLGRGSDIYKIIMVISYLLTAAAGGVILYSVQFSPENKKTLGKLTGGMMLFIGAFGVFSMLAA